MTKSILVTGATGKQGGSVILNLIKRDVEFHIFAVTRDVKSSSAQKLAQKSSKITLIEGNLDDPATIFNTVKEHTSDPVWGVFSVQVSMTYFYTPSNATELTLPRRLPTPKTTTRDVKASHW